MINLSLKNTLAALASLMFCHGSTPAAESLPPGDPKPRLYLTQADVARLRRQAARPELAAAYADLETKAKKSVAGWLKKYPSDSGGTVHERTDRDRQARQSLPRLHDYRHRLYPASHRGAWPRFARETGGVHRRASGE